ncbi:hypothetical protein AJ80_08467 [Polytolypa hystricis UAMH7299]|uniref:MRH domain-containing protein n=1 Tax=Polytolypa hystricis (strain UAMH7299) TaxID=1447883 RepID=A0A2B7X874_POLH7|nr:hypothetical protein AJ80_08467 [Polytolypa hystricis UAMH7299]
MRVTRRTFLASVSQLLFLLSASTLASDSPSKSDPSPKPCTIHSPSSGSYFDLSLLSLHPPERKNGEKGHSGDREDSWHARGHDYPANFTINICAPVIETLEDVVGVDKGRWQNVSAFYNLDGKTYSLGQQSSEPVFRGRKLVLNYTDGSPCPSSPDSPKLRSREIIGGDDDKDDDEKDHDKDDDKDDKKKDDEEKEKKPDSDEKKGERRKSAVMSFLCDRDLNHPAISYVATMDSCSYFFEVRSAAGCGGVAVSNDGGLGPAGVFGIIAGIAVAAYFIGGCAYQRTVLHQRGWRQCPNYSLWAGIGGFLRDLCIILFSSLQRCLSFRPSNRGYAHLSNGNRASSGPSGQRGGGGGGIVGAIGGRGAVPGREGRRMDVDEENRLIDQLDEEWDD